MIDHGALASPEKELESLHLGKTKENYIPANLAGNRNTAGSLNMVLPRRVCSFPKKTSF